MPAEYRPASSRRASACPGWRIPGLRAEPRTCLVVRSCLVSFLTEPQPLACGPTGAEPEGSQRPCLVRQATACVAHPFVQDEMRLGQVVERDAVPSVSRCL